MYFYVFVIITVVIGISIMICVLSILNRCKKMNSDIIFLQDEFFKVKKSFIDRDSLTPLSNIANEICLTTNMMREDFPNTYRIWQQIELAELDAFEKNEAHKNTPFTPSEALKKATEEMARHSFISRTVNQLRDLYQEVYCDLLGGRITLKEAEEKLKQHDLISIAIPSRDSPEIVNIYNQYVSEWTIDNWKERLNFLRRMKE